MFDANGIDTSTSLGKSPLFLAHSFLESLQKEICQALHELFILMSQSLSSSMEICEMALASLQKEFEAVMLPRHSQNRGLVDRHSGGKPHAEVPYKRLAPKGTLPGAVDWRGSLVDSVVKDQAACGSCWSFAATGALEAAHLLATGGLLLSNAHSISRATFLGCRYQWLVAPIVLMNLRGS